MDSKQVGLNPGSVCTVSFTAKPFRWPAIATDSLREVNRFKSTTYEDFSIAGDSPRRTRFHSPLYCQQLIAAQSESALRAV
jgi:hypothetical protein